MVVQKYGGTSVATIEKIRLVAQNIKARLKEEKKMIVVVSAMSGETDNLISLGKNIGAEKRELDQLASIGENKTISLLAGSLNQSGVKAISLTGWQAGVITSDDFSKAKINKIKIQNILQKLENYDVVVVAGFQGITKGGDITTLGKGGSDTTALALAGSIGCRAEIFTDVCGIFSADPKVLPLAKKLECIDFASLMEMSACGAKIMETRSVEIAAKYGIEFYVSKSLKSAEEGTKVMQEQNFEGAVVKNLAVKSDVRLVKCRFKNQGDYQKTLEFCNKTSQNFEMFSFEKDLDYGLSFIVDEKNFDFVESFKEHNSNLNISILNGYSKLTLVGAGFRTHKNVVSSILLEFEKKDIQIKKVVLSEISVEILILKKDFESAIWLLNNMFELEEQKISVAIVGATGLVGRTFLKVLEESELKSRIGNLFLFASKKSKGINLKFLGKDYVVQELTYENIKNKKIDYAFFSAGEGVSKQFAKSFVDCGAVVIDNSSAFRMEKDVPLVVPEINFEISSKKIIANPNCSTIQCVLPLYALKKKFGLESVAYATYQAVSGSGEKGIEDFRLTQNGSPPKFYPYPIFNNCLPHIGGFQNNGFTSEEMKMVNETKKILSDDGLKVSATCVRVPVENCHSVLVSATLKKETSPEEILHELSLQEGVVVLDDITQNIYPINDSAKGKNAVFVGRVRKDLFNECMVHFWCVADNVRKGAALNGVQILEKILKNK